MKLVRVISVAIFNTLLACATVTTPTGGPKDEILPELVSSNPSIGKKNFKGRQLELTFSEPIKLKDAKEEILITPTPGKNTTYTVKKNKLIIEPENDWKENTTYSLNFREGVQDLTEGNPVENLRLAFSTGPEIDSLSIEGGVSLTFSDKIPEKITVALYQSDTVDIFTQTPTYFTKTNKEGKFSLQNLKGGSYYIYAFDDKNKNLKIESKNERFGYRAEPIELATNQDSVNISLIAVDARKPVLTSIRHTSVSTLVRLNKNPDSLYINIADRTKAFATLGDKKSELIFYHALEDKDSIKVNLFLKDSIQQILDTTFYIKKSETKVAKETFSVKELLDTYNPISKRFTYQLSFNKPISNLNLDSIYIKLDSLNTIKIESADLKIDTLNHTLELNKKVEPLNSAEVTGKSKQKKPFLRFGKGAMISYEMDTSKVMLKEITFLKEEETGSIAIKIITKSKDYIVQLLIKDEIVIREIRNATETTFRYLKPLEYKIRVIIDTNKNGKWDAGNFYKAIEPEKVIFYKSEEGKYTFPIRANWEVGPLGIKF